MGHKAMYFGTYELESPLCGKCLYKKLYLGKLRSIMAKSHMYFQPNITAVPAKEESLDSVQIIWL